MKELLFLFALLTLGLGNKCTAADKNVGAHSGPLGEEEAALYLINQVCSQTVTRRGSVCLKSDNMPEGHGGQRGMTQKKKGSRRSSAEEGHQAPLGTEFVRSSYCT